LRRVRYELFSLVLCHLAAVVSESGLRPWRILPAFVDELFPQDIAAMLKGRLTFKEAIESPAFSLMSRHRLKVAQRDFYSRLDTIVI
jgi:hypothetical protein